MVNKVPFCWNDSRFVKYFIFLFYVFKWYFLGGMTIKNILFVNNCSKKMKLFFCKMYYFCF